MKLKIKKETLVNALQIITPITDKSSSKPILSNFLLTATKEGSGTVEFSATDYELSIKGAFPAEVEIPGSVCISARKVLDASREFLVDEVSIISDEKLWVSVEGGPTRLHLPSVDVGLYPQMEQVDLPNTLRFQAGELKGCIDLTLFAAQTSETRKNLMGVCLSLDNGTLAKWTATDGHRLAQVQREVKMEVQETPPEIIIPRKSLVEMQKVLEGNDQEVTLSFDEKTLMLVTEGIVFTTRLIEGKFPNVDQVIPHDNDKSVLIDRQRFINALKIISLMSQDKIKPVKLSLQPDTMKLESERVETGDAFAEVPVEYQGEELQVGFNARYLLDVLTVANQGEKVRFELKGALNPCLIRVPEDATFLSVIMPLRIEW